MRIDVDHNLCQSYAECIRHAPETFSLDQDDRQQVTTADVDASQAERVMLAVASCPMQAIRVEE